LTTSIGVQVKACNKFLLKLNVGKKHPRKNARIYYLPPMIKFGNFEFIFEITYPKSPTRSLPKK